MLSLSETLYYYMCYISIFIVLLECFDSLMVSRQQKWENPTFQDHDSHFKKKISGPRNRNRRRGFHQVPTVLQQCGLYPSFLKKKTMTAIFPRALKFSEDKFLISPLFVLLQTRRLIWDHGILKILFFWIFPIFIPLKLRRKV